MILSRLSSYLRERQRASIADMANGLDSTVGALESMLATLERKGRVRRVAAAAGCGTSCCKCDPASVAVYEWTGDERTGEVRAVKDPPA